MCSVLRVPLFNVFIELHDVQGIPKCIQRTRLLRMSISKAMTVSTQLRSFTDVYLPGLKRFDAFAAVLSALGKASSGRAQGIPMSRTARLSSAHPAYAFLKRKRLAGMGSPDTNS